MTDLEDLSEKQLDTKFCKVFANLYDILQYKGVKIKAIETDKPIILDGKPNNKLTINFGLGFNQRHIKLKSSVKNK